jgi:hypothetical protein
MWDRPTATPPPDSKKTTSGKSGDFWTDDPWTKPAQSPPTATIATKPAPGGSTNNSPHMNPPANISAPSLPPTLTSASGNVSLTGATSSAPQSAAVPIVVKPNQAASPATNVQQPWVPLIASVLGLAGSLAANLFLGWSYLDARQKYQSLVRRTADTFRRAKPAAA